MFERDGRKLPEFMLDLMSDDQATRYLAAGKIWQMARGSTAEVGVFEPDYDAEEAEGFDSEVLRIVSQPDFPADALLTRLITLLRALEAKKASRTWMQNMPGDRQQEMTFNAVARKLIESSGNRAKGIVPELIAILQNTPESAFARFAADLIGKVAPGEKAAVDPLFKGLAARGDEEDFHYDDDDDTPVWNAYVRALAAFAKKDPAIVERLVEVSRKGKTEARLGALATLEAIGPPAAAAVPRLQEMIDDSRVSNRVVSALRSILPNDDPKTIELLKNRLASCKWSERAEIIKTLLDGGMTERSMVELLEALNVYDRPEDEFDDDYYEDEDDDFEDDDFDDDDDDDDEEFDDPGAILRARLAALEPSALHELADAMSKLIAKAEAERMDGVNTVLGLLADSGDDDPNILPNAIAAVGEQMPDFPLDELLRGIVSNLYGLLHDYRQQLDGGDGGSWIPAHEAITTGIAMSHIVQHIGPRGAAVLSGLAAYFRTDTDETQLPEIAAEGLLTIGPAAASLADVVLDHVFSVELQVNPDHRIMLFNRHGLAESQLQKVIQMLVAGEPHQREKALEIIKEVGPQAAVAYEAIVKAMDDEVEMVRTAVPGALAAIGSPQGENIEHLMRLSNDPCESVRWKAADAFGSMPDPSDAVIDRLIAMTRDVDDETRGRAMAALGRQGKRLDEVVAVAAEMLSDHHGYDYTPDRHAADVLEALGPRAAAAVPNLIGQLEDDDCVNFRCVDVLAAIGPAAAPALDRLRILMAMDYDGRERLDEAIRRISGGAE